MRRLGNLVACLCLVLLAPSCAGTDDGEPEGSETDASAPESEDAGAASCTDLLSDEQAAELVGSDVGTAQEGRAGELPACQWGTPTAGVQVLDLPADEWIAQLPALIAGLRSSGLEISPDQRKRLDEGLKLIDEGASADEACETFSTLAEIQGMPDGSDSVTNIFPSRAKPEVVSAQTCTDGRFTSVTFGSPDLRQDVQGGVKAAETALATVQENAGS